MQDYEKLGVFYLGRVYDPAAVERVAVRPRKSDVIVEQVLLLWLP
jgi:hypothetical protein